MNNKKLLAQFPELWAISQDWLVGPEVKICRAPSIGFLKKPVTPLSPSATRVEVYVVTTSPSIERVSHTFCGEKTIKEKSRAVDLRRSLSVRVLMRGEQIRYFFLVDTSEFNPGRLGRITVVKPPVGKKHFGNYLKEVCHA